MKLRVMLAAVSVALLSTGCASKICKTAEDAVVNRVADIVTEKLACKNNFAVRQSVLEKVESIAACSKVKADPYAPAQSEMTGPVANLVCPFVASWVAGYVGGKVPAEWQCEVDPAKIPLKDLVLAGCLFLPVEPKPTAVTK